MMLTKIMILSDISESNTKQVIHFRLYYLSQKW